MKSIIFLLTTGLFSSVCFGQADSTAAAAADTTKPKSTLTIGTVYANNASYYGQKAEESTPYAALAATWHHKSGLYLTGLAYKILTEKTSTVSASSLGAGINFKMGKKLSADLSYSHSFYPAYSPLLQAANPDNGTLAFTYESWVNITLTGDYAFGKTNDGFATGAVSKSINLFSPGKKDVVTLNPSVDVVAGTQHFYQTYLSEKRLRDSVLGLLLSPILGSPSSGSTSKTVATTAFNLLSYNLKLPLAYNRAHYMIEANYQLSVLSSQAESGAGKTNSFVTLSFYYQF